MGDAFLIEVARVWRLGRGRYWRPDRCGYTDDALAAGVYTLAEAEAITAYSDRGVPVPALAVWQETQARLEAFAALIKDAEERSEVTP